MRYSNIIGAYKRILDFSLKILESLADNDDTITPDLLNRMKECEISVESSPFFCIIKFNYDGFTAYKFERTFDIIISHQISKQSQSENIADTAVSIHLSKKLVVEIEVYNVDSSVIDLENTFEGEITIVV